MYPIIHGKVRSTIDGFNNQIVYIIIRKSGRAPLARRPLQVAHRESITFASSGILLKLVFLECFRERLNRDLPRVGQLRSLH